MIPYTVTVEADDNPAGNKMVIRLETTATGARVLEVAIVAGSGGTVSSLSFPHVSLDILISAFTAPDGRLPDAPEATAAPGGTKAAKRGSGDRSYRRMPDPTELVTAYRQASSVTELASRYGVPRHTMNGWLSRLRQKGLLVGR
ncbi:hypothetical protein [Paractinoplanes rishiriensis]|uniref:Uncharacterized protein n=1 Tax=Paractinoplanes rishiriensis TaxID=1050105 RepID=A0A919MZ60_9ACTN|nr:hypothetical protein [Actinoplanes rishiriensis]GIF01079.1 hypothetical protein Ari01nite_85430 [Actinoplanes rishiriensis]